MTDETEVKIMSRPSFIEPLMACSTANLTKETMDWITRGDLPGVSYPNEYGAFVYVPEDDEGSLEGYPDDLRGVIELAREYDCGWIKFDRDAPSIGDLPTWEW
jgi:hypothetical protein